VRIPEDVPPSFAYDRKSDTAFVRHKLVAELFATSKTHKHSLPIIVQENPDKYMPMNPYLLDPNEKKYRKIFCGIGYQAAELSCFLEKTCYKPFETIHIKCLIKYTCQTPKIKEINCKLIQRVEFYLDVVKIKERTLLESFYALTAINKNLGQKYDREEENLLSLDLNKVVVHGASVNSHTYDLYHLAYTLPNSIDDPIIKCIYFVEVQLNYNTFFKMEPTILRMQVIILPKSIYDVQIIQEQNMKGHINELEARGRETS